MKIFETRQFNFLSKEKFLLASVFLFLLLIPEISFAKVYLDHIAGSYEAGAMKWQPIISGYAKSLFWKLVMIDFTWTAIVWVKDRKEFGEVMASLAGKIITIGFFVLLLMSATDWIPAIIGSFSQIGKEAAAAGGADVGTLDSVLFTGIDLSSRPCKIRFPIKY